MTNLKKIRLIFNDIKEDDYFMIAKNLVNCKNLEYVTLGIG